MKKMQMKKLNLMMKLVNYENPNSGKKYNYICP